MINKYSFLLAALLLIFMTGQEVWRMQRGTRFQRMGVWAVLVVVGVGGWWAVFRPTPTITLESVAAFDARIGAGRPVLLELYSEY